MPIRQRAVLDFTPTQFDTAADKMKFYQHFIRFVESGFKDTLFHDWFYKRLSMTFGHIAHHDRNGFYGVWFHAKGKQLDFLIHCVRQTIYGSPEHTYCDVEIALQHWIENSGLITKMREDHAGIEKERRRQMYLLLKAEFENEDVPAR